MPRNWEEHEGDVPIGAICPTSTIKEITRNELYRGVRVWNRTKKMLNPADWKKNKRVKPQSEWMRVPVLNCPLSAMNCGTGSASQSTNEG